MTCLQGRLTADVGENCTRSENRIRMSMGLEDCADIEPDMEQAIG